MHDYILGSWNGLKLATGIASSIVKRYGMSETFDLVSIGGDENKCSVEVISKAEAEISRIINKSHSRTLKILTEHKKELDLVASELLVKKTLYGEEIKRLIDDHEAKASPTSAE